MATPPWIVNLVPQPDAASVGLLDLIRLSLKDAESYINPGSIHVGVGYAKTHSHDGVLFDSLARTTRGTVSPGPLSETPATVAVTPTGIRVAKNTNDLQPSVYFTAVDAGSLRPSAMVCAIIQPETVAPDELGPVLGLEYGPRNTGAYLFFQVIGGVKSLRLVGPQIVGGYAPDYTWVFDWTDPHRYILVWNQVRELVELFVDEVFVGSVATSEFLPYIALGTRPHGGAGDVVGVYGVEGPLNNSVLLSQVAVTVDVAFPFVGLARSGLFLTTRRTDELVRFTGGQDPRNLPDSHWLDIPETLIANRDTAGTMALQTSGAFRITKATDTKTLGIYRHDPSFARSPVEGFILESTFFGISGRKEGAGTGMSFLVCDGLSVFQLDLLDDGVHRTIGLLKKNGDPVVPYDHFLPANPTEWTSPQTFRLVVNVRRAKIELFVAPEFSTPALSITLDRAQLPSAIDYGWGSEPPFVALGHLAATDTAGSLDIYDIKYTTLYQAWEAADNFLPDNAHTDPVFFVATSGGFSGPLNMSLMPGQHSVPYTIPHPTSLVGTAVLGPDGMQIICSLGEALLFARNIVFDPQSGGAVEVGVRIDSWKRFARSGAYAMLDDGVTLYMMGFTETEEGKFVTLAVAANGTFGYVEKAGLTGEAAKLSFPIDWTKFHTYRLERRPLDGVYIYVDSEREPRLVVLDSEHYSFPTSLFADETVAFGQFNPSGGTSTWTHCRSFVSTGFEISIRKAGTELAVEEEVVSTRALVTARVQDTDV